MIIGEAPGKQEEEELKPFVGGAGQLLDQFLAAAGLTRNDCYITNVCKYRPPANELKRFFYSNADAKASKIESVRGLYPGPKILEGLSELRADIHAVRPELIIALGNYPLWAVSNLTSVENDKGYNVPTGVGKWRGSMLPPSDCLFGTKLIPIFHPAAVMRMWAWKNITLLDFKRAAGFARVDGYHPPDRNFIVRPSFVTVMKFLDDIESRLRGTKEVYISVDIENLKRRYIANIGLALSPYEAICIPFTTFGQAHGYFDPDQERTIILRLHTILRHPLARVIGQYFGHDLQHLARWWGLYIHTFHDTYLAQHTLWPGTQKDLAYMASMYCPFYVYWKDDGKDVDEKIDEDVWWQYNCKDTTYTYEVCTHQREALASLGLEEQFRFLMDLVDPVSKMMLRGVRIHNNARTKMLMELIELKSEREAWFEQLLPGIKLVKSKNAAPWYRSTAQQKILFYDLMRLPMQKKRGTGKPTVDDQALDKLAFKEPIVRPICERLQEYRSLGVFASTFVDMSLDHDGRARSYYNIGGTETYRFSSSTDAFGYGLNLQNIPKGTED